MKRWLLAVAILVGGAVSFSQADYILLRAVLGGGNKQGEMRPGQPGAPPGSPGAPGSPGGPPGGPPLGPPGRGPGGDPTQGNIPTLGGGGMANVDTAALAVQGVVVVKKKTIAQTPFGPELRINHKWSASNGMTRLFNDNTNLILREIKLPSPHVQFETRKHNAFKGDRRKIITEAEWALSHGLNDEFAALMDGLVGSKEDANPTSPQELKDAVKAYATVKESLEKPADDETRANFWRNRLSGRMETSKHYAVIYTSANANPPEVQSRLAALENHMRAFYYWFALKGHALPVPGEKLVAVVLDTPAEFRDRSSIGEEPLVDDGFYSHRDHICIFSAQRLDSPYQVFERQVDPLWKAGAYDRQRLLEGTEKRRVSTTAEGDFARMMTLALLERALDDEAERAAVSHEGSRQLLVATGLVPRTVVIPQWAEFGSAAVFETPKGPFRNAPLAASVALYPGVAGPSWAYLRPFLEEVKAAEGRPQGLNAADLLKSVITDVQFNNVVSAADKDGLLRARANAWALAYHLHKSRLPGMIKFYQELSALPRDLEVDGKTLLACFGRAFDCANRTNDGVDPAAFEQFAKDWVSSVKGVPLPGAEMGLDRELSPGANNPGQPGGGETPGGPQRGGRGGGGRPGGGGGGNPGGGPGGP
jgi:hypothetical protein